MYSAFSCTAQTRFSNLHLIITAPGAQSTTRRNSAAINPAPDSTVDLGERSRLAIFFKEFPSEVANCSHSDLEEVKVLILVLKKFPGQSESTDSTSLLEYNQEYIQL